MLKLEGSVVPNLEATPLGECDMNSPLRRLSVDDKKVLPADGEENRRTSLSFSICNDDTCPVDKNQTFLGRLSLGGESQRSEVSFDLSMSGSRTTLGLPSLGGRVSGAFSVLSDLDTLTPLGPTPRAGSESLNDRPNMDAICSPISEAVEPSNTDVSGTGKQDGVSVEDQKTLEEVHVTKVSDLCSLWEKRASVKDAKPNDSQRSRRMSRTPRGQTRADEVEAVSKHHDGERVAWLRCATDMVRRKRKEELDRNSEVMNRLFTRIREVTGIDECGMSRDSSCESSDASISPRKRQGERSPSPTDAFCRELMRSSAAEWRVNRRMARVTMRLLNLPNTSSLAGTNCPRCGFHGECRSDTCSTMATPRDQVVNRSSMATPRDLMFNSTLETPRDSIANTTDRRGQDCATAEKEGSPPRSSPQRVRTSVLEAASPLRRNSLSRCSRRSGGRLEEGRRSLNEDLETSFAADEQDGVAHAAPCESPRDVLFRSTEDTPGCVGAAPEVWAPPKPDAPGSGADLSQTLQSLHSDVESSTSADVSSDETSSFLASVHPKPGEDSIDWFTTLLHHLELNELEKELRILVPAGVGPDRMISFVHENRRHDVAIPEGCREGQEVPIRMYKVPFLQRSPQRAWARGQRDDRYSVCDSLRHGIRTPKEECNFDAPEMQHRFHLYRLLRGTAVSPLLAFTPEHVEVEDDV